MDTHQASHQSKKTVIEVNPDRCGICGCCVAVCMPQAITLHSGYLEVNPGTCTQCMKCIPVCPVHALDEMFIVDVFAPA